MTDNAESADNFDAEFEAARAAEEGDDEHEDTGADGGSEADGDDGDKPAPVAKAEPTESEKAAKSLQKALRQERRERQALQAQIEELRAARPAQTQQAQQPSSLDPSQMPDPDVDPVGAVKFMHKFLADQAAQQAVQQQQQTAQTAQQRQAQKVAEAMSNYEQDFAEDNPAYFDAVKHLQQSALDEYLDAGFTQQQAQVKLQSEFMQVVQTAIQQGRDPAELAFKMAVKRGFKAADPVGQKMATIKNGQKAASPVGAGSATAPKQLTYANVANLKGAAFDTAFEKLRQQERRR